MPVNLRVNSLLLLLARSSAQVLAVFFTAVLARKLGVQDFGRFAYIASLIFVGNTFTNFGTDTFLVRETARADQVTGAASQALSLQLILSVIYCLVMLALRDTPLFLYSLALFPMAIFSVNNALLRALGRFDLFWFLSLTSGVIQVLAAFLSADVLTLCLTLLGGQILVSSLSLILCHASLRNFHLFPLKGFIPVFKLTLPFAALTILLVLIQRLGIIFTSSLLGNVDTGYFSAVVRVVEGLKLGHYAILGALLPALSKGGLDSWRSFRKSFLLLMIVSLFFSLTLLMFSNPIIQILFGEAFLPASNSLALLGWSLLPYTVSSFISYDLIARGLEQVVVKAAFLSLLIYIILYPVLISVFGLSGAVHAALGGEWMQGCVFAYFYVRAMHSAGKVQTHESR